MRVTRATARREETQTIDIPLQNVSKQERAPLGDITEKTQNETLDLLLNLDLADQSVKVVSKYGKGRKKARKADQENIPDVLEDDDESESSSAVEEACQELQHTAKGYEVYQIPMHDRSITPPSKAVKRTRRQLSSRSHAPRFDPDIHRSPIVRRSPTKAQAQDDPSRRDSFFDIITRTPFKPIQPLIQLEEVENQRNQGVQQELVSLSPPMASPVGSPLTPTTRKRASRIEDSLEALDAMEDAFDEVQKSLANVSDGNSEKRLSSTALDDKLVNSLPARCKTDRHPSHISIPLDQLPTPKKATVPAKTAQPRPRSTLYEPTAASARAASLKKESRPQITTPRTATVASPKSKVATSSTARQPVSPLKPTKRVTTSAFQLPGEVVAAKLKAEREARIASRTSAAAAASPSVKPVAKPTAGSAEKRKSLGQVPEVKMTAATLARINARKGPNGDLAGMPKTRQFSQPTVIAGMTSKAPATVSVRAIKPRPSAGAARDAKIEPVPSPKMAVKPSPNNPLKRSASVKIVNGASGLKAESSLKKTASLHFPPPAKQPTVAVDSSKAPLQNKTEDAKRARAEAAERGRLASQQWAEKMRKGRSVILAEDVIAATRT